MITIETRRSMEPLDASGEIQLPQRDRARVYDIHRRTCRARAEMKPTARSAQRWRRSRLWVNPDCGLKTRGWPETWAALKVMVEAARHPARRAGLRLPFTRTSARVSVNRRESQAAASLFAWPLPEGIRRAGAAGSGWGNRHRHRVRALASARPATGGRGNGIAILDHQTEVGAQAPVKRAGRSG